jgi:hypothetical protein
MILIEFLFAPTVPSAPSRRRPRVDARVGARSPRPLAATWRDVVDDADREVVPARVARQVVEDAPTIAG